MSAFLDLVKGRKSVRTFDGRPVSPDDRAKLETCAASALNPFDIPVEFVFLDAAEHHLFSPVISGAGLYAAGKVAKKPYADVAFGFSFEQLVLYAWSLGIGTTWIGGTMRRELFEKAAGLADGEMMPCVTPLGYPAKSRTLKENMMRRGIGADSRMDAQKLFFDEEWEKPLSMNAETAELAELVRWAPSAVNKQPWRIVRSGDCWHFYEKKDARSFVSEKTGDLQKIDVGIALCHFVTGLEETGKKPAVSLADPEIEVPLGVEYIATVQA